MKNGFTITELLAVITILGILSILGGISVFGMISKVKDQTLKEGIEHLKEASISYIETKKMHLQPCKSNFNPVFPDADANNKECYTIITLQDLLNEQLFDPGNLSCSGEKKIVIYRVKEENYNEIKAYVEDDICIVV